MKPILPVFLALLIAGCATTASDVVKNIDPKTSLPTRAQIERDLRGCGFSLESVKTDLRQVHPEKFHPWSDEVYESLLATRLSEAFRKSGIIEHSNGSTCLVAVTVTEAKFGNEAVIAAPSVFAATTTVSRASGEPILAFPMETGWVSLTSVILPGFVTVVAIPRAGLGAHAYEITAMAVLITRTLSGLREGKTFDEIELEKESGGGRPRSDLVVRRDENNPLRLAPIGLDETSRISESLSSGR